MTFAKPFLLLCLISLAILFAACQKDEEGTPSGAAPQPVLDPQDSTRVLAPAGYCVLGNTPDGWGNYTLQEGENPVYVDSFYLDRYEVSNQRYVDYLDSAISQGGVFLVAGDVYDAPESGQLLLKITSEYSRIYFADTVSLFEVETGFGQIPVVMVSWYGASAFAEFYGKRLPSEAEWEKAARGTADVFGTVEGIGVGYIYPWGNAEPNSDLANFGNPNGAPEIVDSFPGGMSWFGAFNMAGNVGEWTQTSIGSAKVHRGGSFLSETELLRTASRSIADPLTTHQAIGFRCAADP